MAIHITNQNAAGCARPSDDVYPGKKREPEWNLQMAKFIYYSWVNGNCQFKTNWQDKVKYWRSYAYGEQDTYKYKKQLLDLNDNTQGPPIATRGSDMNPPTTESEVTGYMNVDFSEVFSPLPKYIMKLLGMFKDLDVDIAINAIDEIANGLRLSEKSKAEVEIEHGQWKKTIRKVSGIPQPEEDTFKPKTISEMDLFEAMGGFKLPHEIGYERALAASDNVSDMETEVKDRCLMDLFVTGFAAIMDETDPYDNIVRRKYVDIQDVIIDRFTKSGSRPSFGAVPVDYTIQDLRAETNLTEEEIFDVLKMISGTYNYNYSDTPADFYSKGYTDYDNLHIPVLKNFYVSTDSHYFTTRINRSGRRLVFEEKYDSENKPRIYNTDKRKTNVVSIKRVYQCYWIVGTEYVFNYGPMLYQPFDYRNKDVRIPITIKSLPTKSPLRSAIPIEDQISLAFYRMQNGIATARPEGVAIEVTALENVTLAGKKIEIKDSIRMLSQTGNIVYKQVSPLPNDPNPSNVGNPIHELKGTMGSIITDAIRTIEFNYNQLSEMMGIDRISAVSKTPVAETGLGVIEMAKEATMDTTSQIITQWSRLKLESATNVILRIQSILFSDNKMESQYWNIIGMEAAAVLRDNYALRPMELGITFVPRPTSNEKNNLLRVAETAMMNGKNGVPSITYGEFMFIQNRIQYGTDLKYVQAFLAYREGKKEEADRIMAAETQKIQSQMNQAQEEIKAKKEINLKTIDIQGKKEVVQLQYDLELRNKEREHEWKMKELGLVKEKGKTNLPVSGQDPVPAAPGQGSAQVPPGSPPAPTQNPPQQPPMEEEQEEPEDAGIGGPPAIEQVEIPPEFMQQ